MYSCKYTILCHIELVLKSKGPFNKTNHFLSVFFLYSITPWYLIEEGGGVGKIPET